MPISNETLPRAIKWTVLTMHSAHTRPQWKYRIKSSSYAHCVAVVIRIEIYIFPIMVTLNRKCLVGERRLLPVRQKIGALYAIVTMQVEHTSTGY